MRRGVVFIACHNTMWEVSEKLIKAGVNPDKLSHDAMAAELTNHLIPGVRADARHRRHAARTGRGGLLLT